MHMGYFRSKNNLNSPILMTERER